MKYKYKFFNHKIMIIWQFKEILLCSDKDKLTISNKIKYNNLILIIFLIITYKETQYNNKD